MGHGFKLYVNVYQRVPLLPSGIFFHNYGKSSFIVNFPMKNGDVMVIFHSYVKLPGGKPPFSYGFPMDFLWFSIAIHGERHRLPAP